MLAAEAVSRGAFEREFDVLAVPFLGTGEAARPATGAARRRHLRAVA